MNNFNHTPIEEVPEVQNTYPLNQEAECTCYNKEQTGGSYFYLNQQVCKHEYHKMYAIDWMNQSYLDGHTIGEKTEENHKDMNQKTRLKNQMKTTSELNAELQQRVIMLEQKLLDQNNRIFDLESERDSLKQQKKYFKNIVEANNLQDPEQAPWEKKTEVVLFPIEKTKAAAKAIEDNPFLAFDDKALQEAISNVGGLA